MHLESHAVCNGRKNMNRGYFFCPEDSMSGKRGRRTFRHKTFPQENGEGVNDFLHFLTFCKRCGFWPHMLSAAARACSAPFNLLERALVSQGF